MALDRKTGEISHHTFAEFPDMLRPGDLLIRNNVRVRPARLYGRDAEGRLVEVFLLESLDGEGLRWLALAKPGRRAKRQRRVRFEEGIEAVVEEVHGDGKREVRFDRPVDQALLGQIGHVPLPPYIRRDPESPDRSEDREAYQTVFAREPLAVAAPTAGLHFTIQALQRIERSGVVIADLTLAIGSGTFKPVTAADTDEHRLDKEETWVPAATISRVVETKRSGGRVVAVGTTVTRALETAARLSAFSATEEQRFPSDLFILPGFRFLVIDALLTNFHLPRSTLLMLVCAFAGRESVLRAYEEAVREGYAFYSYGDAMFIS